MQRKLVQQGNATLMVSLPADWIKEFHLKKGATIDLEAKGNQVTITPGAVAPKESALIKLHDEIESSIRTRLTVPYRRGYDRLEVQYSSVAQRNIILSLKSNLLGFDVIEQTDQRIILENIMEPSLEQFDVIFDKVIFNIKLLATQVRNNEDVTQTEERIFAYDNFCRRCISKNAIVSKKKMFYWTFLAIIVHASRELTHYAKLKVKSTPTALFAGLEKILEIIHRAYATKDISLLSRVHSMEKELIYKNGYSLLKKNSTSAISSYHLLVAIRQCYLCTSSLTGLLSDDN